jgi:type I restriction enzyme S subunit
MRIRLRYLARVNPATPEFDRLPDDAEVSFLPLEAVWPGNKLDVDRLRPKDQVSVGYTRFREGDILVPKITPTFQADRTVIATGLSDGIGAGTTELHVVRVGPSADRSYVRYLLSSKPFLDEGEASMTGVAGQKRVPDDCLRDLIVPVTDAHQQRAIADYLDTETARIDALIEKKRRMVELLDERRQFLTTAVITRGLNPTVALRPTGIDWLPLVPSHWKVVRLKYLATATIGLTYSPNDIVSEGEGGTLVLRAGNITDFAISLDNNVFVTTPIPHSLRLRGGEILMCARNGSPRLIGKSAVVPRTLAGSTWGAFMVVLRSRFNSFLPWIFGSSMFSQQIGLFATATINQLTSATLTNMAIPFPPEQEREEIVRYLNERSAQMDEAVVRLEQQAQLLAEYRGALITAAVIGELDIPGAAA